ncbi:unnamed protein product [Rotaria sp. Silwood2]|nr:unnamed protein product [Rotaria sp. Silwood2]
MSAVVFIIFTIFIQVNKVLNASAFGSVFPIPLNISNDDPNFRQCPEKSGNYAHTTKCSLFHACTLGIHTIYSCIDGFLFNPASGECQYWPMEKEIKCAEILQTMKDINLLPSVEPIKNHDYYYYRRKSATSKCIQTGIYPDILDCSLFHYCHQNQQHEIFKCPNGLHFDPQTFMCSAPQLVNCQYESPTEPTIIDDTSTIELGHLICRDYAPGTHLPVSNKFDEFIICGNNGKRSIRMKCKPGFNYNALTMNCEMINNMVLNNLDVELKQTAKHKINISTEQFLLFPNNFNNNNNKPLKTNTDTKFKIDVTQKQLSCVGTKIKDTISVIEKKSTANSQLSRIFHHLSNDYDQQQEIDDIIKIIVISILTLTSLILFSSIIFGISICIRLILFPSTKPIGAWKTLIEESNV